MTEQETLQILKQRWRVTDEELKKILQPIRKLYKKILQKVVDEVRLLKSDNLNKLSETVSDVTKRHVQMKIQEWQEKGLDKGYFRFLLDSLTYRYADVIKLLVYGCYMESLDELNNLCNRVFEKVAKDCIKQVTDEINISPEYDWDLISSFLFVPIVSVTFKEYLEVLLDHAADEVSKQMMIAVRNKLDITGKILEHYMRVQPNRLIDVNEDKYSGALNDTTRSLWNQLYVYYAAGKKVVFIAEMDERTTEMCRSLDGQVFNVSGMNSFDRYSAMEEGMVHYNIYGLQPGINLPPIDDHFHWCRSTIKVTD